MILNPEKLNAGCRVRYDKTGEIYEVIGLSIGAGNTYKYLVDAVIYKSEDGIIYHRGFDDFDSMTLIEHGGDNEQ